MVCRGRDPPTSIIKKKQNRLLQGDSVSDGPVLGMLSVQSYATATALPVRLSDRSLCAIESPTSIIKRMALFRDAKRSYSAALQAGHPDSLLDFLHLLFDRRLLMPDFQDDHPSIRHLGNAKGDDDRYHDPQDDVDGEATAREDP